MQLSLLAKNVRVLSSVRADLSTGLHVLVGANGAGKTTLLEVLTLCRDALEGGNPGPRRLRSLGALDGASLEIGAASRDLSLRRRVPFTRQPLSWEWVLEEPGQQEVVLENTPEIWALTPSPLAARLGAQVSALTKQIRDSRVYGSYDLATIRTAGSKNSSDLRLDARGHNVFSVLRNWRDKRSLKSRFDFVEEGMKEAFPDLVDGLQFQGTEQAVFGQIVLRPTLTEIEPESWAHGLLVTLLHLCAVASVEPGSVVAMDEPENGLHPFALRVLLGAMEDWVTGHDAALLLATHSVGILNEMADRHERVLVLESAEGEGGTVLSQLRPLSEIRAPEWLSSFALGDLYLHNEYGAPAAATHPR